MRVREREPRSRHDACGDHQRGSSPEQWSEGEDGGEQHEGEHDRQRDLGARRPVGTRQELAAQDLVDDLGMHVDARFGGGAGRCDEIAKPDRAGADQYDPAGDLVGVRRRLRGIEKLIGGDARHARETGEVDAELAGRPGRHLEVADLEGGHGRPAGVHLTARASGADHERAGAKRRPQRLDRERRVDRVAAAAKKRHHSDDAVGARREAVEAETARGLVQLRQIRYATAKRQQIGLRIGPGESITGLGWRQWSIRLVRQHETGGDSVPPEGVGKEVVVVGKVGGEVDLCAGTDKRLGGGAERRSVGLGEDHVEGDRCRSELTEVIDDLGELRAWPWPLPDLAQRRLVDVDDGDRRSGFGTRFQVLVKIENERA